MLTIAAAATAATPADLGGPDLSVPQHLCGQGTQQSLPLVCWTAQVLQPVAVAHHGPLHD